MSDQTQLMTFGFAQQQSHVGQAVKEVSILNKITWLVTYFELLFIKS